MSSVFWPWPVCPGSVLNSVCALGCVDLSSINGVNPIKLGLLVNLLWPVRLRVAAPIDVE